MATQFRVILLLLTIFYCNDSYGQLKHWDHIKKQTTATDPTVASLLSHNFAPVGHYSGKLNYGFDFFKYGLNDKLSVPIRLEYNSLGNKVSDISSNTGLGWNLTGASGTVTRQICDVSDFDKKISSYGEPDLFEPGAVDYYSKLGWLQLADITGVQTCEVDAAPDVFSVNAPGLSTKFYITKNLEAVELNGQKNKIELLVEKRNLNISFTIVSGSQSTAIYYPDAKNLYKLVVTTPQGVKYTFDAYDVVLSHNLASEQFYSFPEAMITLFLTGMEDLNSRKIITYEYDQSTIGEYSTTHQEYFLPPGYYNNGAVSPFPLQSNDVRNRYKKYLRIKNIHASESEISFLYNHNREDIVDDKALTGIVLKDINQNVIKNYRLDYGYFTAPNCSSAPECKKLKLNAINNVALSGNKEIVEARYEYFEDLRMPVKSSKEKDYFGYFNGNGATTGKPAINFYPSLGTNALLPFTLQNLTPTVTLTGENAAPNDAYTKQGLLKTVHFDTGGGIDIEYEANVFRFNNENVKGGGSRVKYQIQRDNVGVPTKISYYYETEIGSNISTGNVGYVPVHAYPIYNYSDFSYNSIYNNTIVSEHNLFPTDNFVGYKKVHEVVNTLSTGGKTTYQFTSSDEYPDLILNRSQQYQYLSTTIFNAALTTYSNYPFMISDEKAELRGRLLKKETRDNNNQLKTQEISQYTLVESVLNSIPVKMGYYSDSGSGGSCMPANETFYMVDQKYASRRFELTADSTKSYFNSNVVVARNAYQYRTNDELLKQKITYNSKSLPITYTYYYPDELSYSNTEAESARQSLVANYIWGVPLKYQRSYLGSTESNETLFKNWSGGRILPSVILNQIGGYEKVELLNYSDHSNVLWTRVNDVKNDVFLWSYNGNSLIGKIENADFNTVSSILGGSATIQNFENVSNPAESSIVSFIDPLRSSSALRSLITTYVYKPLVGITRGIDARGQSKFYEYDLFNRLDNIKDNNQSIMNQFAYHVVSTNPFAGVIYARLELDGGAYFGDSYNNYFNQDLYIRFYMDASCTIPYVLQSPIQLILHETVTNTGNYDIQDPVNPNTTITINAGVSSYFCGVKKVMEYNWIDYDYYFGLQYQNITRTYSLNPNGTAVQIVQ
ncbi:hypothetical protein [Pedobacter metabolipauper]|uniref:YD repeat-containing protein n=1 Tax=Pedobacter metabolipauper TaxID=425513 RepID=A0A4R6SX04_9SPHI|nr:hypothetical protein [Pedobacter metabolipauper]TDQ09212.1 hypothetical protein ATK78_1366 [Pedobacter metabolipauper]